MIALGTDISPTRAYIEQVVIGFRNIHTAKRARWTISHASFMKNNSSFYCIGQNCFESACKVWFLGGQHKAQKLNGREFIKKCEVSEMCTTFGSNQNLGLSQRFPDLVRKPCFRTFGPMQRWPIRTIEMIKGIPGPPDKLHCLKDSVCVWAPTHWDHVDRHASSNFATSVGKQCYSLSTARENCSELYK